MNQISGATSTDAPVQAQDNGQPPADLAVGSEPSGFGSRGRVRRRARFLRKARELAYRDLGGLVFNLHRFGQRNDPLVLAKLNTVAQIDAELRTLEAALQRREPVTVLREAGINACPRCAAIHSSEDRFCPNCGLPMARHVDLPIAGVPAAPSSASAVAPTPQAPAPPAPSQPAQATTAASTAQAPTPTAPSTPLATSTPPAPSEPAQTTAAAPTPEPTATPEPTEILKPQPPAP